MKKIVLLAVAGALMVIGISGCGMTGAAQHSIQTQVQLNKANYTIAKKGVYGVATTGSALCSIPLGDSSLWRKAMADLHKNAKLGGSQALANVTWDFKFTSYLGFWCVKQATVSADVIQFTGQ